MKQQHPQEKNDYENLVIDDILHDKCKNIKKIQHDQQTKMT